MLSKQPSFSCGSSRRRSIVNLTPLIDVVFILLVFFMLASSFLEWRSISITTAKPPSTVKVQSEKKSLLLSVSETETRLDGELLAMDQLIRRLQQDFAENPQLTVKVQPLADTPLQPVIKVLDQLKLAEIRRFNLVRDRKWQAPTQSVDN